MRFKIFPILLLFISVIVVGCHGNALYHPQKLIQYSSEDVVCRTISSSEIPICCYSARHLDISDSLLVISTTDSQGFLKVYNVNTNSIVADLCQNGIANNEFVLAQSLGHFTHDEDGDILLDVRDANRIKRINLTQSIIRNVAVLEESFPYEGYRHQTPFFGDSSLIFAKNRVSYTDMRDLDFVQPSYVCGVDTITPYHRVFNNLSVPDITDLIYDGVLGVKPDCSAAIEALSYTDCINLIDLKSGKIKGVVGEGAVTLDQIEKMSQSEMEQLVWCYVDLQTFDDCFILLWNGGQFTGNGGNNEIRVFDWNGVLLERVALDIDAVSFAYDRTSDTLYLLDQNETLYSSGLTIGSIVE